jgi:hypothetical protein
VNLKDREKRPEKKSTRFFGWYEYSNYLCTPKQTVRAAGKVESSLKDWRAVALDADFIGVEVR